jgi:hypothetical protein
VATQHAIEVHGVLWAFDEIQHHNTASVTILEAALAIWEVDVTVWLPRAELHARRRRLWKGR